MKRSNSIIILILLVFFGPSINRCFSQSDQDTINVLFVGNSYTYFNNLPHIVSIISDSTKIKLLTKKSVAPGARLSQHWNGKKNLKTKNLIENGNFDIVILQEQSMAPFIQPDSFYTYGRLLCTYIKANGAKPYLFLTWAREKVPQYQEDLNKAYTQLSKMNDAIIVPVGPAWAKAKRLRSSIELFITDGSHPSELGTFLAACVFVKTLTGEIPKGLPSYFTTNDESGEVVELMYISDLDITFCQKIADQMTNQ